MHSGESQRITLGGAMSNFSNLIPYFYVILDIPPYAGGNV